MSRMQINALTKLVASAEAGGYTLPSELTDALRTHDRVKAVTFPQPAADDQEATAARIVSTVAAGESVDVAALMAATIDREREAKAVVQVQHVIHLAVEQAAGAAANVAADLTERIITKHLRPAFDEVHAQAREAAAALGGYGLDAHSLVTAPAKARNAYASLPALAARKAAILEARRLVNAIGYREPAHDTQDMFAAFAKPLAFHPNWKLPAPIPRVPVPEDAVERLLWMAGPEAAIGKPWLPTVAEQDEAWLEQFESSAPKAAPWKRVVANA